MIDKSTNDGELQQLIVRSYDHLPEPMASRMDHIEQRLLRAGKADTRRPGLGWFGWFLLAAAATGAASWWIGEQLTRESQEKPTPASSLPIIKPPSAPAPERDISKEAPPVAPDNGPTVHKRER